MMAANIKQRTAGGGADHTEQPILSIDNLVLIRVSAAAATRAELQRDLAALAAPKINGTQFRRAAELAIGNHISQQRISEQRGRLSATDVGLKAADSLIAPARLSDGGWDGAKSILAGRALNLKSVTPAIAKALTRPEGLAALVLQRHFGLPAEKVLSPTSLRSELAVVALERAFGNKIKTGLGKGSGLPGKAGRVLAGQLFKSPREVSTDGKLVVALAVEILKAPGTSIDDLTIALLRRLTVPPATDPLPKSEAKADARRPQRPSPTPDNDQAPLLAPPAESRAPVRPDLAEFSHAVVSAARPVSEGWPGNRKAFISLVWNAIRNARPEWELSEVAFKGMLAEAHRTGHVVLAGADLKDKCDLKELEDSKILYKNTVWHFVRVED
ncbi:MAG: hypothetical protein ABL897_02115 [Hyphomicrobium sp.]